MSRGGHSTLRGQAFALQRLLDIAPDARAWITHGQKQLGLLRDVPEIADKVAARLAGPKVGLLLHVAARLNDVGQHFLELLAIHFSILSRSCCPAAHRREAFSALLSFKRSRSFMRALCNCDLLLPMEQPIISAISLCS